MYRSNQLFVKAILQWQSIE